MYIRYLIRKWYRCPKPPCGCPRASTHDSRPRRAGLVTALDQQRDTPQWKAGERKTKKKNYFRTVLPRDDSSWKKNITADSPEQTNAAIPVSTNAASEQSKALKIIMKNRHSPRQEDFAATAANPNSSRVSVSPPNPWRSHLRLIKTEMQGSYPSHVGRSVSVNACPASRVEKFSPRQGHSFNVFADCLVQSRDLRSTSTFGRLYAPVDMNYGRRRIESRFESLLLHYVTIRHLA